MRRKLFGGGWRLVLLTISCVLAPAARGSAQQRMLTLDDIYGVAPGAVFSGVPVPAFTWIDGDHYAWPRATGNRNIVEWVSATASTGATAPLCSATPRPRTLSFDARHAFGLFSMDNDLYVLNCADGSTKRVSFSPGEKQEMSLSPDGKSAAFIRGNNLFTIDLSTGTETALTQDGSEKIRNGTMDWVYEEEIYGRGTTRAYWWSPDSSRVAFLRIDDTPVSTYITLDDIGYEPKVETWSYPRAGDPNPKATLGVARIAGGALEWADLSKYSAEDILIVRVGWTPASQLVYEIENRTQSWLDLSVGSKTILHETNRYWINSEDQTMPTWLRDGSFVWLSAQSGFTHAYLYRADGSLIRPLTSGKWEVRDVHGVDE